MFRNVHRFVVATSSAAALALLIAPVAQAVSAGQAAPAGTAAQAEQELVTRARGIH
jgi:hypothetical protein